MHYLGWTTAFGYGLVLGCCPIRVWAKGCGALHAWGGSACIWAHPPTKLIGQGYVHPTIQFVPMPRCCHLSRVLAQIRETYFWKRERLFHMAPARLVHAQWHHRRVLP